MEKNPLLKAVVLTLVILSKFKANGQISTPCTSSIISSFTPCLNYLTGSSANGGSPTAQCCDSLKSLMTDSVECGCLIVTGNVPVSVPFISRPLVISLPRACKTGVPLRCKATGVPLPAPGPALFRPPPAPVASSPLSPKGPALFRPPPAPVASSPLSPKGPALFRPTPAPVASSPLSPKGNMQNASHFCLNMIVRDEERARAPDDYVISHVDKQYMFAFR
ncbi:non-specific lipid transfer protein GPI-anchored 1-like [Coffea eugenioides]|uniref:non-specific lipid transfer protein GPI-anchored 1-like n=1 Tax=Coffea eugenioides TaxID=49369 RepID=UPI000F613C7F|nr:non-specific lipid transfer protein GPI-anchored 1-like [Coffea eugenioides]